MDTISVVDVAEAVEAEFDRLKERRPALSSRIGRAENILVTHLSCPKTGIILPRTRGGELVGYLVKGSGGAVYRVEPKTFSCSCPDYHRSNLTGCKHGIACYALGRAFRPSPTPFVGRRCNSALKVTRYSVVCDSTIAERDNGRSPTGDSYGETTCSRCLDGQTYDGQRGEWVVCERCGGSGRVRGFVYSKPGSKGRRLAECAGCKERFAHWELVEVTEDHESLTWFPGDKLCLSGCARAHGVL